MYYNFERSRIHEFLKACVAQPSLQAVRAHRLSPEQKKQLQDKLAVELKQPVEQRSAISCLFAVALASGINGELLPELFKLLCSFERAVIKRHELVTQYDQENKALTALKQLLKNGEWDKFISQLYPELASALDHYCAITYRHRSGEVADLELIWSNRVLDWSQDNLQSWPCLSHPVVQRSIIYFWLGYLQDKKNELRAANPLKTDKEVDELVMSSVAQLNQSQIKIRWQNELAKTSNIDQAHQTNIGLSDTKITTLMMEIDALYAQLYGMPLFQK